jgi:hypothetical protein
MLVALGDKPARRTRTVTLPANTQIPAMQKLRRPATQSAKAEVTPFASSSTRAQTSASVQPDPAQTVQGSAHTKAKPVDAESAQVDANLASELIASGVTTQPVETVIAVLAASRDGASINAAAKASGINYRTAQRIVGCRGASAAAAGGGRLTAARNQLPKLNTRVRFPSKPCRRRKTRAT